MKKKVLVSWSSGKDAAWTAYQIQRSDTYELAGILTTLTESYDRVSMHAVRQELLERQAQALNVPLYPIWIPPICSNFIYEERMKEFFERIIPAEIKAIAYGDLFLEDVRQYRLDCHKGLNVEAFFPLWGLDTHYLAQEMVQSGLKACLTCVDPSKVPPDFCGREFDLELLKDLPDSVDPCGEKGEFHTFCYAGPMFLENIAIRKGELVERDGFVFCDFFMPK